MPGVSVCHYSTNLSYYQKVELIWNIVCCLSQIAIVGYIVNGPGEMAYADFGYVGGAPGKIDLCGKCKFSSSINRVMTIQKFPVKF